MGADRTPAGSTRAWRKLRAEFAARLPLPCALCDLPVLPDPPTTPDGKSLWHLHHVEAFVRGGTKLWPAHKLCNLQAGDRVQASVYVDPTL